MDRERRARFSPPAVGGVSLLVAFAVLSLTIFALLSLSTVQADLRLADAAARAVSDYYAADVKAQEVLACLRGGRALPEGTEVNESAAREPGQRVYSYAVPMSDTRELQVEVRLAEDGGYTVLRWEAVSTGEWTPDEDLHVWDGNLL